MEARLSVVRAVFLLTAAALALGACGKAPPSAKKSGGEKAITTDVPRSAAVDAGITPMAERVAVLGFLNKRNGIVRDLTLKPGQAIRIRDAVVRLRACETSAPWENAPLTGAFVQLDVQGTDAKWKHVFSGWLYKESPSLNVVEHSVYDVWPKSCAMNFPAGPAAPASSPHAASNVSSAKKSGGGRSAAPSDAAPSVATVPETPPSAPPPEPLVPVPNATPNN